MLNVKIVRTDSNSGAGCARNKGIESAIGEWIIFVDSDDYVDDNFFGILEKYTNSTTDIVLFDYYKINKNDSNRGYTLVHRKDKYTLGVSKEEEVLWGASNVCGKAYKRSLIKDNKIQFPKQKRYEDWVFYVKSVISSSNIVYAPLPLYYYVDNPISVVNSYKSNVCQYSMAAYELLKDEMVCFDSKVVEAIFIREVIYVAAKDQLFNYSPIELNSIIEKANEFFPNWKNNIYIKEFSKAQRLLKIGRASCRERV